MDSDVVMPPAQRGEVLRIMGTATGPSDDVMDLKAVAAVTTINHTTAVTRQNKTPHLGWNNPGGRPHR